jgi:hypothetical protein
MYKAKHDLGHFQVSSEIAFVMFYSSVLERIGGVFWRKALYAWNLSREVFILWNFNWESI